MKHKIFDAVSGQIIEIPFTQEEIEEKVAIQSAEAWKEIRRRRDEYLRSTDYLLLEDSILTGQEKIALKQYRQSLRNLPDNNASPHAVSWPDRPSFVKEIDFSISKNSKVEKG